MQANCTELRWGLALEELQLATPHIHLLVSTDRDGEIRTHIRYRQGGPPLDEYEFESTDNAERFRPANRGDPV